MTRAVPRTVSGPGVVRIEVRVSVMKQTGRVQRLMRMIRLLGLLMMRVMMWLLLLLLNELIERGVAVVAVHRQPLYLADGLMAGGGLQAGRRVQLGAAVGHGVMRGGAGKAGRLSVVQHSCTR